MRQYEAWRPSASALATVEQATIILGEYRRQGLQVTLRQLYYQFVARGLIPNEQRQYKRLGELIGKARMAGLIDWSAIEDRTRNLSGGDHHNWEPQDLVRAYSRSYHAARWTGQPVAVEVWVEKEALAGVVEQAVEPWLVPYFSCRGYVSQSELHVAARRLFEHIRDGRRVLVLHLGDHDPSGMDMTRDMTDRLQRFIATDWWIDEMGEDPDDVPELWMAEDAIEEHLTDDEPASIEDLGLSPYLGFELRRIALNSDQVRQYNPPPNPVKLTDSRSTGYIDRFGRQSWELDALDPATLSALIRSHIEPVVNMELWDAQGELEDSVRRQFAVVADHWREILDQFA